MIHEVIVTTVSQKNIVHIAPMGIQLIDDRVIISPFRPSQTLENITKNNLATINFIDDVRVFAGIVTKYKKDWELEDIKDKSVVPRLTLANTHYNVIAKEFKDDEKRPNIVCDISKKVINKILENQGIDIEKFEKQLENNFKPQSKVLKDIKLRIRTLASFYCH